MMMTATRAKDRLTLDDEAVAALARAASLAGDAALLPRLETLVRTYRRESADGAL